MGSGGSKKQELQADGGGGRERRPSHVDTNPPAKSDVLVECDYCDRRFAADRIHRHSEVCQKTSKNPRDKFDVQGQRLQGTEAEGNLNTLRRENSSDLGMTMTNWKSQHDQHLREIEDAKRKNSRDRPQSAFDNVEIFEGKRR